MAVQSLVIAFVLAINKFQRRPTRRVFWVWKRRTSGERLQSEFAVVDGISKSDLPMLVRVVATECRGRHERGEPVAGLGDLGGHLEFARPDRRRVFTSAIDEELIRDRLCIVAATAGWQEDISVAVAAGA